MTPATIKPLTQRQQSVLDWIVGFIKVHHYGPTVREVAFAFNFKNPNAAAVHLNQLRKKGHVTWEDGKSRTIRIVKEAA
jgi:repressor LexA